MRRKDLSTRVYDVIVETNDVIEHVVLFSDPGSKKRLIVLLVLIFLLIAILAAIVTVVILYKSKSRAGREPTTIRS